MSQQTDHDSTPTEGRWMALPSRDPAFPPTVHLENHDCVTVGCRQATDDEIRLLAPRQATPHIYAPTPPPTAAPEPPQAIAVMKQFDHFVQFYAEREMTSPSNGQEAVSDMREMLRQWDAVLAARPHRIGVWDYQSLCDCLKHNLERAIPGYSYRDPQDAIQTLAARVMTLERKATAIKMPTADSTSVTFGATDHCRKCGVHLLDDNSEDVRGLCDKCATSTAEGPREGLEAMEWLKANRILELDDEYPELPHGKEQFIRIRFPHAVEAIDLDREENGDPQYAERYLGFWQEHLADLLTAYANAALERAAQIAEEHGVHEEGHGRCPKAIAAEIRKLAKP